MLIFFWDLTHFSTKSKINFYECKYFEYVYRISMIDEANIFDMINKAKIKKMYIWKNYEHFCKVIFAISKVSSF